MDLRSEVEGSLSLRSEGEGRSSFEVGMEGAIVGKIVFGKGER